MSLKHERFLAIDVGNSNVTFALFESGELIVAKTMSTLALRQKGIVWGALKQKDLSVAVVASVVPKVTTWLKTYLKKNYDIRILIAEHDFKIPIKTNLAARKKIGADRLVAAYCAKKRFKGDLIVVDFGTAITLDVVSKEGVFLGGVIAPGIELSLKALGDKTAQLPDLHPKGAGPLIGRNTKEAMASGAFYGLAGLCEGIIARMDAERGLCHRVILTGGSGARMHSMMTHKTHLSPHLTLQGLALVLKHSKLLDK